MNRFLVWVEVEEVNEEGDHVADHSIMLDGAALASFDTLNEAVEYGDRVQRAAERLEI